MHDIRRLSRPIVSFLLNGWKLIPQGSPEWKINIYRRIKEASERVNYLDKTPSHFRLFENQLVFARNTQKMRHTANIWLSVAFKITLLFCYFSACDWISNGITEKAQPHGGWAFSALPLRLNRTTIKLLSQQPDAFGACQAWLRREKMAFFFSICLENLDPKTVFIFNYFRRWRYSHRHNFMPCIAFLWEWDGHIALLECWVVTFWATIVKKRILLLKYLFYSKIKLIFATVFRWFRNVFC